MKKMQWPLALVISMAAVPALDSAVSGQTLPADTSVLTEISPAERFKAFMASPPVIKEMLVKRSYPARGGAVPDQYYLIRYQPGAFLFATASGLKPLLNPARLGKTSRVVTNTTSGFFAAGRYGSNWWTVSGLARTVTSWSQKADKAGTHNPVWKTCMAHFGEGMEFLFLGINDLTFTPEVIGTWGWTGDAFQFHAE